MRLTLIELLYAPVLELYLLDPTRLMRTRSLSQRQLPRRPRQHTSQNIVQEDDVYVPSDSEESAQSTETEDVEPEQHRPSQATRSHNRKALSLETEDLDVSGRSYRDNQHIVHGVPRNGSRAQSRSCKVFGAVLKQKTRTFPSSLLN